MDNKLSYGYVEFEVPTGSCIAGKCFLRGSLNKGMLICIPHNLKIIQIKFFIANYV